MNPVNMVAFFFYFNSLRDFFAGLIYANLYFSETFIVCEKMFRILHRKPEFEPTKTPAILGNFKLTDMTFTYSSRVIEVFKDLNLEIKAGETVAFVGPSGGGKSSIIGLLERFYEPEKGSVTLDGVPIRDIDHEHYHGNVALVDQIPTLFNGTIRSNIMYGYEWGTKKEMVEAAKMANIHEFVMGLKNEYNTECGEGGVLLSGGRKQRIAIARALVIRKC